MIMTRSNNNYSIGWCFGQRESDGQQGWFPMTFMVEIDSDHAKYREVCYLFSSVFFCSCLFLSVNLFIDLSVKHITLNNIIYNQGGFLKKLQNGLASLF